MGVMTFIRRTSRPGTGIWNYVAFNYAVPYLSISVTLNVLLTLMIVVWLVLHNRNIRVAMGCPDGVSGWYKTTVTMLVESSTLFSVSSLLVVGCAGSGIVNAFIPILCQTQVCVFPLPGFSGKLSNVTVDLAGNRFAVYHQTSCQP